LVVSVLCGEMGEEAQMSLGGRDPVMSKRIYHRHEGWEDFKAGMYRLPSKNDSIHQVSSARMMLSQVSLFFTLATKMVEEWKTCAEANLTNPSLNHQAWIGHASACYFCGASESQAIEAWHQLDYAEQLAANRIADEVIANWREWHA
jgi:hypothetical protein